MLRRGAVASEEHPCTMYFRGLMGAIAILDVFSVYYLFIYLFSYLVNLFYPAEEISKQFEALLQLKLLRLLTEVTSKTCCCVLYILNVLLQLANFKQCSLHKLCRSKHIHSYLVAHHYQI